MLRHLLIFKNQKEKKAMIGAIKQKTIVEEGGKIEIISPELPVGATADVIICIDEDQDITVADHDHSLKKEMSDEEHHRKLENMYASAPCNEYYSPSLLISKGKAVVVIPVQENFFHAANAVHGSVYFKALDDAAFFAANSLVKNELVLTVSFNVYLTRPISEGEMKSVGKVVHFSKNLIIAESVLTDAEGREIARGNGSFAKSKLRLSDEIGYI